MLRWALYVGGGLLLFVVAVLAVGYLLPVTHVASAEATFAKSPSEVFATLVDVQRYAEWRSDVSGVEVLAESPSIRWRESGSNGPITFQFDEVVPPSRLRARIVDTNLAFGGTWTYELTPAGTGTRVRVTENGEVYNPIFRVMSRFIFGHAATMEQFLQNLGRRLGQRAAT